MATLLTGQSETNSFMPSLIALGTAHPVIPGRSELMFI